MISYDIQTTEFNCYLSPSHVNKGTRLSSPPDQIEKKKCTPCFDIHTYSKGTTKNMHIKIIIISNEIRSKASYYITQSQLPALLLDLPSESVGENLAHFI